VHLKFGAAGRFPSPGTTAGTWLPGVQRSLAELTAIAAVPRADTGARLPDEQFCGEMIGSFFAYWSWRRPHSGRTWAVRTWHEFAEAGQIYSRTVTTVPPRAERITAWRDGLASGARFLAAAGRHGLPACLVGDLLGSICAAVGEPPLTGW
jgi:hypothetical protein